MMSKTDKSYKSQKRNAILISVASAVVLAAIVFACGYFVIFNWDKLEVNTDIETYNDCIGENAVGVYQSKWDMDETVFPEKITDSMTVNDYISVYYDPWDAQYLSCLAVSYTDEAYSAEVERLKSYNSTEYLGYYGVTGFSKYELLAMYADEYNGFVYAITDNKNEIIYVELIFCNYIMDLDYNEYINKDYLPDGFDATTDNKYREEMMREWD